MEKKLTIELSVEHAQALVKASELMARLGLGQIEYLAQAVRDEEIRFSTSAQTYRNPVNSSREGNENAIESLCTMIKSRLGFRLSESRGIGHPDNSDTTRLCWELRNSVVAGLKQLDLLEVKAKSGLAKDKAFVAQSPEAFQCEQIHYSQKILPVVHGHVTLGDLTFGQE